MAANQPWNRVNIPSPGAISSVRIQFSEKTDANVIALLVANENVLKLINSELLQTEIRVLYELLYILKNSCRGNKTFKGLQQVEQCVNRLKNMKLDVVLQELADVCPTRIQSKISIKTGECDVPSQPMLEWMSLKLLGAAQLMSCTLSRCSRAFMYPLSYTMELSGVRMCFGKCGSPCLRLAKQQMKWEFIILNMVITSMLSRLWVIFRAILVCLFPLYKQLLELRSEVAHAHPMPYLTDFSLPADMTHFLHPSDAHLLRKRSKQDSNARCIKERKQQRKNQKQSRKMNEDLGVSIKRDIVLDADMKPFLNVFRDFTKGHEANMEKNKFKKQLKDATTFADMETHLKEIIHWCKSKRMRKEKHLLTFLHLKCQKMKSLEAEGYNMQRKLQTFRQEASWASSPQGSVPRTMHLSAAVRRKAHLRNGVYSFKSLFRSSLLRIKIKNKRPKRQQKTSTLSVSEVSEDDQRSRATREPPVQAIDCDSHDDIDDIFSSIGL